MSAFGDHTPKQDLLEYIEVVKSDYDLSWMDIIKMLLQVMEYITEYLMR